MNEMNDNNKLTIQIDEHEGKVITNALYFYRRKEREEYGETPEIDNIILKIIDLIDKKKPVKEYEGR